LCRYHGLIGIVPVGEAVSQIVQAIRSEERDGRAFLKQKLHNIFFIKTVEGNSSKNPHFVTKKS